MIKKKIILASTSPRRSELLSRAGFNFIVKVKEVEETYPADLEVERVAEYIAKKKAYAAREFIENNSVLLAADSIVALGNKVYGKPKDAQEAFQILTELSGKPHDVFTGVCLLSATKEKTFTSLSKVYFEPLSEEEIRSYIEEFQPFDKAGAYAIQEWIGLCKVSRIEGLYSNIMGLPVADVYKELLEF